MTTACKHGSFENSTTHVELGDFTYRYSRVDRCNAAGWGVRTTTATYGEHTTVQYGAEKGGGVSVKQPTVGLGSVATHV